MINSIFSEIFPVSVYENLTDIMIQNMFKYQRKSIANWSILKFYNSSYLNAFREKIEKCEIISWAFRP